MSETQPTASVLDLMRAHVETAYVHDTDGRLVRVNDWVSGTVPRFWLGMTGLGCVWRFRADVPAEVVVAMEDLCRSETGPIGYPPVPLHANHYENLLGGRSIVERVVAGPTYRLRDMVTENHDAVPVTPANQMLLAQELEDWIPDVTHQQPVFASIEDGRAVSVCASVRISESVHMAGVETAPGYRRRGHAMNAVAAWAAEVRSLGALAFYSTSWDNAASQAIAVKLGARFGFEYYVT